MKNTEEKLFLVNGIWLVGTESSLEAENLYRLHKRQKLFIRYAKRFMMGPVFGMIFVFLFLQLQTPLIPSLIVGLSVGLAGLMIPFKYVKNAYWILLIGLYGFLISQMVTHWDS